MNFRTAPSQLDLKSAILPTEIYKFNLCFSFWFDPLHLLINPLVILIIYIFEGIGYPSFTQKGSSLADGSSVESSVIESLVPGI